MRDVSLPSSIAGRLALAACVAVGALLAAAPPASAAAAARFSIAFADLDVSTLSAWDAGRMRLMLWVQADTCVRKAGRGKRALEGELTLTLQVAETGKATQVQASGSTPVMKKAASCLAKVLRKQITFPQQAAAYRWSSRLLVGEVPAGLSVSILRVDTEYVSERTLFESAFTVQIERATCLAQTLEPGLSAALNAELALTPGKPTLAKVTRSTHVEDAVLRCLEPQLAAIVPPTTGVPAKVNVFFHVLQPAPAGSDDEGAVIEGVVGSP